MAPKKVEKTENDEKTENEEKDDEKTASIKSNDSFEDFDEFPSFEGALGAASPLKSSSSLILDPTVSGLASLKKFSPVWCKHKNHPWWPAIIHSVQYISATKKGKKEKEKEKNSIPASPMKKLNKVFFSKFFF